MKKTFAVLAAVMATVTLHASTLSDVSAIVVIPEPTSLALVLAAFGVAGLRKLRNR
jgi:hypothetical protein